MLQGIGKTIEEVFYPYIKTQTDTGTVLEKNAEKFLIDWLEKLDYYKENPEHFGAYKIKGDHLDRAVVWAMVKGTGSDTVVFVHHSDIVGTEDFKLLKPFAYLPEALASELEKIKDTLNEEARSDLESGEFIFGRGTADMKAGGAIQLAMIKHYSQIKNMQGNVILIAVPDEENLSAGMRGAAVLLDELKAKYQLRYKLMINSEPHQRKDKETGIFSEGSVGKLMPFVYVRGYLSHAGKIYEGFNPVNVLAEVVRRVEMNTDFSDFEKGEASPPPTWLYTKDSKEHYDVSMPISASGCFSVLTLNSTPGQVLEQLRQISWTSFEKIVSEMNGSWRKYNAGMGRTCSDLPWKPKVSSFSELYQEAFDKYGEDFVRYFEGQMNEIGQSLHENRITMVKASFELVEAVYDYVDDLSPRIVYGLTPPYYPSVSNLNYEGLDNKLDTLSQTLSDYAVSLYGQRYTREYFFTGISDLSYTYIKGGTETARVLEENMPLFGKYYDIPVESIQRISMPGINIGPWGKDFHKLTERVSREDMFIRTPELVHKAVGIMLGWE